MWFVACKALEWQYYEKGVVMQKWGFFRWDRQKHYYISPQAPLRRFEWLVRGWFGVAAEGGHHKEESE